MKNIHVLPTDKPSRLYKFANELYLDTIPKEYYKKYNIYITSDEKIKFNDYITDGYKVWQWKDDSSLLGRKKIILTTDQDLIKDGVQAIDDEFLEWFVKNPSCEWVETEKWLNDEGGVIYSRTIPKEELKTSEEWQKQFPNTKVIDPDGWDRQNFQYSWFEEKITLIEYTSRLHRSTVKGIIPKEEPKQETLEDAYNKYSQQGSWQCPISFEEGAKWQSERMYSEEDLREAFRQGQDNMEYSEMYGFDSKLTEQQWLNQFKKK